MQIKIIIMLVVAMIISSLVASTYYYKAEYEKSLGLIGILEAKNDQLEADKASLKDQAAQSAKEMGGYIGAMDKLSESSLKMARELSVAKNKLAKHKLSNLRNGRHSELVLKVINRSIVKQNKAWMAQGGE